jgi:hypothetical protein
MAAYTKTLHVGVTDVLAGHSVLCCLSTSSSSSLTSAISATKRLFMDSGGSPGVPRLVLLPCSYTTTGTIGTFASIRRPSRWCRVRPARHRMSEVSSRGDAGGCTSQPSVALNKVARCEPLTAEGSTPRSECASAASEQFRTKPFLHDRARLIHKVLRFCEAGCSYPPVWTAPKDSLLGSAQLWAGGRTALGINQGPCGFLAPGSPG